MANTNVSIFTTAMRTEFVTQYEIVAPISPWDKFVQQIPSTARIENYDWMTPTPGLGRYTGHRRLGKLSNVKYRVENLEWDSAFEVLLRDIQDDQTGGYLLKPKELAMKAKLWPGRLAVQTLNQGMNNACFDGTNFFATTHAIGGFGAAPSQFASGGGNKFVATTAGADGVAHRIVVMICDHPLKPLLYQNRKEPEFMTDSDSPSSRFSKKIRYWLDMESAVAYGFWWNAILVDFNNTPTITECQNVFTGVNSAFRQFTLPTSAPGDIPEYVHAIHQFDDKTTVTACSPGLEILLRQVLHNEVIVSSGAPVTNVFKGWSDLYTSGDLNPNVTAIDFSAPG